MIYMLMQKNIDIYDRSLESRGQFRVRVARKDRRIDLKLRRGLHESPEAFNLPPGLVMMSGMALLPTLNEK